MLYIVQCSWQVAGVMEIEADSEDEARHQAIEHENLPDNGEYISDSFVVDDISPE